MPTHDDWIKDGTPAAEPVTSATPVVDTSAAPVAATPAPEPAPTPTVVAPAPTDAGTQSTPAPAVTPAVASDPGAGAAPAAPSAAEQAAAEQDFIDGFLDGKPVRFGVPKGASFQIKRGNEIEYMPFTQAGKAAMLEKDYRIKTAATAERERQLELREKILASRADAVEKFKQEQLERLTKVPATPEEAAHQAAFAELAKSDPFLQQMLNDAAKGRVLEAEQTVIAEQRHMDAVMSAAQAAMADVQRFSEQYGIDPDRLRERFAFDLQVNNGDLSPQNLERLAKEEAAAKSSITSPIQTELEALKAQVAALQAAAAHNAQTDHAINRSTTTVGAPAPSVGVPAPAGVGPTKLTGRTVAERSAEWARI